MSAMPQPSADEVCANATYDALLWALSRPGQVRRMPAPGERPIIEALIDRECNVYAGDPTLMPAILRTGAALAPVAQADHLFVGTLNDAAALNGVRLGSDLYPDDGATLVLRAQIGAGARLRLTGPGIETGMIIEIAGLPAGFWAWRAMQLRYPIGFEAFLLDGDRVIGVPRSTHIEVL